MALDTTDRVEISVSSATTSVSVHRCERLRIESCLYREFVCAREREREW